MAIKQDSAAAVAAFLARGGQVRQCPPAAANATPLRKLRDEADRHCTETGEYRVPARTSAEREAELAAESAAEMRLSGRSARGFDSRGRPTW